MDRQRMNMKKRDNKGFALVELIVALGIFTSVMVIAGTSFFVLMNSNREIRAQQISFDNLGFALDSMLRSMRTGGSYTTNSLTSGQNACHSNGNNPQKYFQYTDQDGVTVRYACHKGILKRQVGGSGGWIPTTASGITIEQLHFYYNTSLQPFVTLVIAGEVQEGGGSRAEFNLQTTISRRTRGN